MCDYCHCKIVHNNRFVQGTATEPATADITAAGAEAGGAVEEWAEALGAQAAEVLAEEEEAEGPEPPLGLAGHLGDRYGAGDGFLPQTHEMGDKLENGT